MSYNTDSFDRSKGSSYHRIFSIFMKIFYIDNANFIFTFKETTFPLQPITVLKFPNSKDSLIVTKILK